VAFWSNPVRGGGLFPMLGSGEMASWKIGDVGEVLASGETVVGRKMKVCVWGGRAPATDGRVVLRSCWLNTWRGRGSEYGTARSLAPTVVGGGSSRPCATVVEMGRQRCNTSWHNGTQC
jgi:hypothetical protein